MPSASDEQRALWGGSDGIGEDKAIAFLTKAGWQLGRDWWWRHSDPSRQPTDEEIGAMRFLVDEWDYGGWTTEIEAIYGRVFGPLGVLPRPRTQTGAPWADF